MGKRWECRPRVAGNQTLVEQTLSGLGGGAVARFQEVLLEFIADGPSVTVSFSDQTTNGESGLADGVLDNIRLVELSLADGSPLTAAHSSQLRTIRTSSSCLLW